MINSENRKKALVVDDEPIMRGCVSEILSDMNINVYPASCCDDAWGCFCEEKPDLAVVDLKMPGAGGMSLLKKIKASGISCRVIIMTGYAAKTTKDDVLRNGAFGFLTKPFELKEIRDLICDALK